MNNRKRVTTAQEYNNLKKSPISIKQQSEAHPKDKPQKSLAELTTDLQAHKEAIAYLLHHHEKQAEAVKDHTSQLNHILQNYKQNET